MDKVLIAMSGGVDSSVAAFLMKEQGCECIGATMKLFHNEDIGVSRTKTCCSLEDVEDARLVALRLGIPYYAFNFSDDFKGQVIDRFISSYERGATPNPCIDCNRYLKFERLYERARILGCDAIVAGHYARIEQENGRWLLKKSLDESKDQSYVLYSLTQDQLAHTRLPLGAMHKSETRRIAEEQGFYNADVIAAEEGYIEMYYQGCAVFVEVGDAFANSPLPDSAEIVAQYVEYDGMTKEDAAFAAGEDLQAYRDELASRSQAAREAAVPRCATGIRASEHYGIDNQWTQKLYDMLRNLDDQNEALQIKITKFDASKLFQDPSYFKMKARLEQVRASKVMTKQEQLATYQEILKDAQAENEKLRAELKELQARLAPPPSATPATAPAQAQ